MEIRSDFLPLIKNYIFDLEIIKSKFVKIGMTALVALLGLAELYIKWPKPLAKARLVDLEELPKQTAAKALACLKNALHPSQDSQGFTPLAKECIKNEGRRPLQAGEELPKAERKLSPQQWLTLLRQ